MQRYFLRLSYNGTEFSGWQFQHNAITIQQIINEKISMLLHEHIEVTGCGRTDAGVHARMFYAHFMSEKENLDTDQKVLFRLNKILPYAIAIQQIIKVPEKAHARFHAFSRTYEYHICRVKDPFGPNLHWELTDLLDINLMNEGAKILLTYDDFEAFSKTSDVKTTICKLKEAKWEIKYGAPGTANEGKAIGYVFTITSNRFLRNMVRAIVGTLVDVGRGKITLDDVHRIVQSKKRAQAGTSVPARGLFLTEILYPEEYNL
ncbi:MAG: tRNA pseudouridine(38-40) synthase TruA [Bacteroidetes bacterium]|nr:tRNA pseudouridine(38-40) synthase TruA [Bacteroidota bacterium]